MIAVAAGAARVGSLDRLRHMLLVRRVLDSDDRGVESELEPGEALDVDPRGSGIQ